MSIWEASKADLEARLAKHAGGGHDQQTHGKWASGVLAAAQANTELAHKRAAERGNPYRDRAEGLKREVGGADFAPKGRKDALNWGEFTAITRRDKSLDKADHTFWKKEAAELGRGRTWNPQKDDRFLGQDFKRSEAKAYWEWRGLRRIAERSSRVAGDSDPIPEQKRWPNLYKHAGGGHDQSSHGNWASGRGGSRDYRNAKWGRDGGLGKRPMLRSEKRHRDAERVKRLKELGVLTEEKKVEFTNPGEGIRELTWGAGLLPGEALVASSFGFSKQPITVDSGDVPLDADVLARLTQQVHETLGELSPEFRVRNVEVTDDVSAGGGQFSGGTTLKISPWAVPMSAEERTALADQMYGKSHPDFIDTLNNMSWGAQVDSLAKAVRHESGHYIENQLRQRTAKEGFYGGEWWRQWSNEVAPSWEKQTEHFFRQEFASREYQSRTRFRDDPLFYTAATHGWSGDHQFEGALRGIGSDTHRNAELFAEYVRFELSGQPFPNGGVIGAHIRKATAMPGVTAPKDGDGDGYIFDGIEGKERRA